MAKRTSLKDIAQAVGVSITLVSYVLNNQKENRISKQVAHRIRTVARELNYQPNQIAKSLKTSKTRTLGVVVSDISNPFSSSLARIIEDEADKHEYAVIFGSSDENAHKCQQVIATLLNRQVDGLLIAAPEGTQDQIVTLQQSGMPFVLFDRYFPPLKTNYVALDNHQSIYMAVQHLIELGYGRIGLIAYKTSLFHLTERVRGYESALTENRLPLRKRWVKEVGLTTGKVEVDKAMGELLKGQPRVEAIVFAANTLAVQGLNYLKRTGIRVPQDVAVVSFDDADINDLFESALTYVQQPLVALGQLATTLLVETLTTKNRITQANLEATLVVQASTLPIHPLSSDGPAHSA